jgi:hypothetical protein
MKTVNGTLGLWPAHTTYHNLPNVLVLLTFINEKQNTGGPEEGCRVSTTSVRMVSAIIRAPRL